MFRTFTEALCLKKKQNEMLHNNNYKYSRASIVRTNLVSDGLDNQKCK